MSNLTDLQRLNTPALLLDEVKMMRNIDRLADRARALKVALRPHLKTAKSADVAARLFADGPGPITVSTLAEAEEFFAAGYSDILYAVGISPAKLARVAKLRSKGCDLKVILDSAAQALAVADAGIPALIEIDSDGHRGGVAPESPELLELAQILANSNTLRGVITHAGESYNVIGPDAHAAFAERERAACVLTATRLREARHSCEIVSVGSTPTAHGARDLTGVTELRAGVYIFFDLVMAGIGVCTLSDIALSVLTSVIGHQPEKGWTLIDAGWMAMSRDRGTADQAVDQGYGVVCSLDGTPFPDLIVSSCNQEHGVVALRNGVTGPAPDFPIGTLLRILPNHACATAAQHSHYNVLPESKGTLLKWERFGGW